MDSSESLKLDEHLARFLAAYDQNLDGGDPGALTVSAGEFVPPAAPGGSVTIDRPPTPAPSNQGSMGEVLPDAAPAPPVPFPVATPAPGTAPHRIGRFELRKQLGKGGCGIVFLAYDPKLEREVALKVPRPEMFLNPDARRRLLREALAAAEFDHPNLVPVYETGEIGPMCFIATAFCPGHTLAQWIDRQAFPVPVRQAGRLVATLAEAVQHAHDRGVLHRDLKPNNVILQELKLDPNDEAPGGSVQLRGEHVLPRVVDFGLAKLADRGGPSDTATRQILGTPKYMAPEQAQARREDIGPPADVYALGVILYELLTGRAPYEGESDVEVLRQAVEGKPVPPRGLRPDLPRDLEAICLKAMARTTTERYRTAIDLADDLRRFLDGRPTVARPLAWSGRAGRWLKRNDQVVAIVVLAVTALFVTGLATWNTYVSSQLRRENDDARVKNEARDRTDREREYARQMRAAFAAWAGGGTKPAAEALAGAARAAEELLEQPGFAHGFLSRLVRAERLTIVCPAGAVEALAVSPDGTRLASGHPDGTVAVWDRATGQALGTARAHPRGVKRLAFARGGTLLVTLGETDEPRPVLLGWLVAKDGALAPAGAALRELGSDVYAFAVSPDGAALYAGGHNGLLFKRAFADAGPVVARAPAPGRPPVVGVAVTHDGAAVWVADGAGEYARWTPGLTRADGRTDSWGPGVCALATNAAGLPVLGFDSGTLCDVQPVCHTVPASAGARVRWIAATAKGHVALNGPAGTVLLDGGVRLPTGDLGDVTAGAFSPSGAVLFTGSADGVIRAWDVARDAAERGAAPTAPVRALAVSPDGARYVTQTDHHATRYDGPRGRALLGNARPLVAARVLDGGEVEGVTFDGSAVAVTEFGGTPGPERVRYALPLGRIPEAAALSADGTRLAVGDSTGRLTVWQIGEREPVGTIDTGTGRPVRRVALSADGRAAAAHTAAGVTVWAVGLPEPQFTCAADEHATFRFAAGDRLLTAGRDGAVRVWGTMGREELALFGHVGRVTGLGVSPDGRTYASGGANGEVRLWDARTGAELLALRRHTAPVTHLEFAAGGKLMVSAGDAQLAVWDARPE